MPCRSDADRCSDSHSDASAAAPGVPAVQTLGSAPSSDRYLKSSVGTLISAPIRASRG